MGRRLALLIATYQYQDTGLRQLTAPAHDAEALAGVLGDPEIAGFEVTTLINEPHYRVGEAIGDFYRDRRGDDLTLLYFTGHGLKDDEGRLYLAMTNTRRDALLFTGLSAEHVDQAMEGCVSRQKVLILDCCYSGAFPAGRLPKADTAVHTLERFQGRGRTVLTASDATQYSFEGDQAQGDAPQSVFTRYLVAGLRDGGADLDNDGDITVDELYSYVHDRVVAEMPQQRPKKLDNVEGRTVIARNVGWSLPAHLANAIESPIARERLAALDGLAHLYRIGNDVVRGQVLERIRDLADDDSKRVSAAATTVLDSLLTRPPEPPAEPRPAEAPPAEAPPVREPDPVPAEPAAKPSPVRAPDPEPAPEPAPVRAAAPAPPPEPETEPEPEHDQAPRPTPVAPRGVGLLDRAGRSKVLLAGAAALVLAIVIVIVVVSQHGGDGSGGHATGSVGAAKAAGFRTELTGLSGPVGAVTFSPDGRAVAAVGNDGTVGVWKVADGRSLGMLRGHADPQSHVALSPEGRTLAVSTPSKNEFSTVRLWTVATGKLADTITGKGVAYSLAFSPDGRTLAFANTLAASKSYDNPIRLWDTATHRDVGKLGGHTNGIEVLAFDWSGKLLASGGSGQNPVRIWDVPAHGLRVSLTGGDDAYAGGLAFSLSAESLLTARSRQVQIWQVNAGRATGDFTAPGDGVAAVGWSESGKALAMGHGDPVVLWDVSARKQQATLPGGCPKAVGAFSPGEEIFADACGDGAVRLWNIN
ncbi:caspase family protein [Actinomadura sp. DC4]|uniref:caspase, EACC1-associated type n=1 Tax=Actinomadura sp. DC4 TaxID=3055069 RepID=UPI0025AF4285|nr:caspase family protein [Actinomadura sp. DC4]MDN3354288.1 caspase family protein [Actinomadura sp. DC4]